MDPITLARLWMVVKPVKRLKEWRKKRKMASWAEEHGQPIDEVPETFNVQDEVPMNSALVTQIVLAILRHAMTASPFAALATDDWLLQTATMIVGLAGLAWSFKRKVK